MNDTFLKWFYKQSGKKLKFFIALIIGPSSIIAILKSITPLLNIINSKAVFQNEQKLNIFLLNLNFALHLIFIFTILLISPFKPNISLKKLKGNSEDLQKLLGFKKIQDLKLPLEIAYEGEQEFLRYWRSFWVAIFLLYIFWCIVGLIPQSQILTFYSIVDTFLNNLAASFLFLCYFSLNKITVKIETGEDESYLEENKHITDFSTIVYLLLSAITVIHLILYLLSLNRDLPYTTSEINNFFKGISGVLFSLSIATVVGKLDSKFINSSSLVIFLLYGYAAIQPLFIFFQAPIFSNKMVFILYLGLVLKVFFYVFVTWVSETKRLYFYFLRTRRLYFKIHHNWNLIKKHLQ